MNTSAGTGPNGRPILNPHVYLNYLTPDHAEQYENSRNVILVTAGAVVWDLVLGVENDVRLARLGFRFSLIPYFFAKLATLAFVVLSVVFQSFPLPDCLSFEYGIIGCWILASVSYCSLLNLRIRDRYRESHIVRLGFLLFLLTNFAFTVVSPLGRDFEHIPGTNQCIPLHLKEIAVVIVFVRLAFGFAVFVAISWHIVKTEERIGWRGVKRQVGGSNGPDGGILESAIGRPNAATNGSRESALSDADSGSTDQKSSKRTIQALVNGGQHYYLVMVLMNFITASFVFSSAPLLYQVMIMVPNLAISTSMACRAYRDVAMRTRSTQSSKNGQRSTSPADATRMTGSTTTTCASGSEAGMEEGRMRGQTGDLQNCQPWVVKHADEGVQAPRLRRENTKSLQSLKQLQLPERERRYSLIQIKPRKPESVISAGGSEKGDERCLREVRSGLSRQIEITRIPSHHSEKK